MYKERNLLNMAVEQKAGDRSPNHRIHTGFYLGVGRSGSQDGSPLLQYGTTFQDAQGKTVPHYSGRREMNIYNRKVSK
jgi:hypothetical protein